MASLRTNQTAEVIWVGAHTSLGSRATRSLWRIEGKNPETSNSLQLCNGRGWVVVDNICDLIGSQARQ